MDSMDFDKMLIPNVLLHKDYVLQKMGEFCNGNWYFADKLQLNANFNLTIHWFDKFNLFERNMIFIDLLINLNRIDV